MSDKKYVWVKYGNGSAVEIDVTNCRNVNGLKEAVKTKYKPKLDGIAIDDIDICSADEVLRTGRPVNELPPSTDIDPLIIQVNQLETDSSKTLERLLSKKRDITMGEYHIDLSLPQKCFLFKKYLAFVNRDGPTAMFIEAMKNNTHLGEHGSNLNVCIAEQTAGSGKTRLGPHLYRSLKAYGVENGIERLANCHYVFCSMSQMITSVTAQSILTVIADAIWENWYTGPRPASMTLNFMLGLFDKDIFLHLDEIGTIFDTKVESTAPLSELEKMSFIYRELSAAMLVIFKNSSLKYVFPYMTGVFTGIGSLKLLSQGHGQSRVNYVPLPLNTIRLSYWDQIVSNTWIDEDTKLQQVITSDISFKKRLWEITSGNPRMIVNCIQTLLKSNADMNDPKLADQKLDEFETESLVVLRPSLDVVKESAFKSHILNLMAMTIKTGNPGQPENVPPLLDLTTPLAVKDGVSISLGYLIASLQLQWSGTVDKAEVYISPAQYEFISKNLSKSEFETYVLCVSKALKGDVPVEHGRVLEKWILRRFQSGFQESHTIQEVMEIFARAKSASTIGQEVLEFKQTRELVIKKIDGNTQEAYVKSFMEEVSSRAESEGCCSIAIDTEPMSSSQDNAIWSRGAGRTTRSSLSPSGPILISTADKLYCRNTSFTTNNIIDEVKKCKLMGSCGNFVRHYVLICSTNYERQLMDRFGSSDLIVIKREANARDLFSGIRAAANEAQVNEVLLVNLTTEEKLAEFLGLGPEYYPLLKEVKEKYGAARHG
jgi:hypothetical protein